MENFTVRCACGAEIVTAARFCGECGEHLAGNKAALASSLESHQTLRDSKHVAGSDLGSFADDPLVGAVLCDRFRIEKKIGAGGFGAVYQGTQIKSGRSVALKVLHPDRTGDATVVKRFRREGEVLCSLRDVHTIITYDFDQTADGTLFIAMELLKGANLHEVFLKEAPIPWQRMLAIAKSICSSLSEAHESGIVHRDLKPENIFLEQRKGTADFVKVLDFGIAKIVSSDGAKSTQLTANGKTVGTLEYMSPEQLMGKELDGSSDIYSLGVVCYELMTGRLPFPDATGPVALITAQLKETPRVPSQVVPKKMIPPNVDDLIMKMLNKTPGERFSSAEALRLDISAILRDSDSAGGAPSARLGSDASLAADGSKQIARKTSLGGGVFWAGILIAGILGAVAAFVFFRL